MASIVFDHTPGSATYAQSTGVVVMGLNFTGTPNSGINSPDQVLWNFVSQGSNDNGVTYDPAYAMTSVVFDTQNQTYNIVFDTTLEQPGKYLFVVAAANSFPTAFGEQIYFIEITAPQPPSGSSAIINLPFIFDLSAQSIEIFGEEVSLPDASFNLTTDLSLNVFLSSLLFKDNESGDMDISFVDTIALKNHINLLNSTTDAKTLQLVSVDGQGGPNYTQFSKVGSSFTPQNSSICNHFLQYVASLLFGHPQAQAPIKNDAAILADLSGDDLGRQFITELSNNHVVRHSMLEQLIDADVSNERFDYSHNDTYHSYPFLDGDKIVFRVKMQGNLFVDAISSLGASTTVQQSTITALFSNITGIDAQNGKVSERIWKVTATLRQ
jgi:hypothetical protein